MYYVYFLKNQKGDLYIGQTSNLFVREKQHSSRSTKSAKFVRDVSDEFVLVYQEEYATRQEAMRREKQLKGWTRAKKEALMCKDYKLLKKL